MEESSFMFSKPFMKLKYKFMLIIGLVLASSIGLIIAYMTDLQNNLVIGQAKQQARMLHHQLILTREWVSDHKGLFVVKSEEVGENPYLDQPRMQTDSGITLVKRNPAMVTRELSEYAEKAGHGWFRVTSLKPVNPLNVPDDFERASLELFENADLDEYIKIGSSRGEKTLRYIAPLKVKPTCLGCHSQHGYKVGDIRGALSITIPIQWADAAIRKNNRTIVLFGLASIIGVTGLLYFLFNLLVSKRLSNLEKVMDSYPDRPSAEIDLPEGEDEIGRLSSRFQALCTRLDSSRKKLNQAREQAFYNEKMASLGQITAGIAHEVNNPLGGLLNCVKNMQDEPDNHELHARYLPLLDRGLRRIESIMRQLLNFGRNEPLQLRKVHLDEEIRECFSLLGYRMKNIELVLDLHVDTPQCIDTEAVKQIIVNIGLNAIQAMPEGGTLTVTSREQSSNLVMIFKDSGTGISAESIDQIFDPFFTTKEVGQGTGLGLAVTYALVQKMGGSICVDSEPGLGTTFTITIPITDLCPAASNSEPSSSLGQVRM
jgi:two-component system NtrC family sensor kinase